MEAGGGTSPRWGSLWRQQDDEGEEVGHILGVLGRPGWQALPSAPWTTVAPSEVWFVQRVKVGPSPGTDSGDPGGQGGQQQRRDEWMSFGHSKCEIALGPGDVRSQGPGLGCR